mmetsp:Transcript_885/g.2313  ORF Transcript_885/g.2313 Transcript_885/m.2313 type:complete len:123 (+) Transcript_885:3200-3568(+)
MASIKLSMLEQILSSTAPELRALTTSFAPSIFRALRDQATLGQINCTAPLVGCLSCAYIFGRVSSAVHWKYICRVKSPLRHCFAQQPTALHSEYVFRQHRDHASLRASLARLESIARQLNLF